MKKLIFSILLLSGIFIFTDCKKKIEGCMDSNATNFNPDATVADESCYYPTFYEKANKIYDDFKTNILNPLWFSTVDGCGNLAYNPTQSTLTLHTGIYQQCGGSANVISLKKFSVSNGTLTFEGKFQPYEDNNWAYGDGQPRGLADGTNRNNAIEFISKTGSSIACRTVADSVATETIYAVGSTVNYMRTYRIVATSGTVQFYLNNNLIATHTTNIPAVPLNVYFGSSCGIMGNVPITVDYVSYETN
jgi:hypothetical protein